MVEATIEGETLHLEVKGWDKLWAFKSRLEIPLRHIIDAHRDPELAHTLWKGIKAPGTHLPGVIAAGTFYQDGKRVFWDVHDPDRAIVLQLADERSDQLVIEVADPDGALRLLQGALAEHGARRSPQA